MEEIAVVASSDPTIVTLINDYGFPIVMVVGLLPVIQHTAKDCLFGCELEVGISEDNVRVATAEF